MPLGDAVAISLLAFGAAFVGTISGFGFALLIVPPLSFVVGPKEAVVLSNALGVSWLATMFVPLFRVERIFLDEEVGEVESYRTRFERRVGAPVEEFMTVASQRSDPEDSDDEPIF